MLHVKKKNLISFQDKQANIIESSEWLSCAKQSDNII